MKTEIANIVRERGSVTRGNSRLKRALASSRTAGFRGWLRVADPRSVRARSAFTLIELLMVIAIIGILAALIVGGAVLAKAKVARYNAESQLTALTTAIGRYYTDHGYYPPDNTSDGLHNYDSVESSLFYEITGCTNTPKGPVDNVTQEAALSTTILADMHVGGILNGADPATVKNYYDNLKASQHSLITYGNGDVFSVFGIPTLGPLMLQGSYANAVNTGRPINPFHYVKTNPTNNPNSYDLWIDVLWSGNTNRVSNWTSEPKPL